LSQANTAVAAANPKNVLAFLITPFLSGRLLWLYCRASLAEIPVRAALIPIMRLQHPLNP
jgi:hypothetical protein